MPQYLIPQKTQREDKILGPLTGKQMLYALITLGGTYLLFATVNINPIVEFTATERMVLVSPLFFLGLALTFVEVNERPFEIWLVSFITFLKTPKIRIWEKEIVPLASATTENAQEENVQTDISISAQPSPLAQNELARLSQLVDNPETAPTEDTLNLGPTSRTLELLQTVEKASPEASEDGAKTPLTVIAKQPKGLGRAFKTIANIPSKILMGKQTPVPASAEVKKRKKSPASDQVEQTAQVQSIPPAPGQSPGQQPMQAQQQSPAPSPAAPSSAAPSAEPQVAPPADPTQAVLEATQQPKNNAEQDKIQNLINKATQTIKKP